MAAVPPTVAPVLWMMITITVCGCLALIVLTFLGVVIGAGPERLRVVLGQASDKAKSGLIGMAAIMAGLVVAVIKYMPTGK